METNENIPRYRAGQVVLMGKASLTNAETTELRRLFDLIADTCDAAGVVLGRTGPPPIGSELERLRALTERVDAMTDRTKSILG
jgi:hypothetical protein